MCFSLKKKRKERKQQNKNTSSVRNILNSWPNHLKYLRARLCKKLLYIGQITMIVFNRCLICLLLFLFIRLSQIWLDFNPIWSADSCMRVFLFVKYLMNKLYQAPFYRNKQKKKSNDIKTCLMKQNRRRINTTTTTSHV